MTMASEAVVMRELGIDYGCLAIVTNYAAGITDQKPAHKDVSQVAESVAPQAVATLLACAAG
jgi:5'-methylthioadenosine phosphorylase